MPKKINYARLQELMGKNNDGQLTPAEWKELKLLGKIIDEQMLENSIALARSVRPELFDENGKPIKRLIRATLKADLKKRNE